MHQSAMAVPRVSQKDAGARKCQLEGREPMLKFSTAGLFVVIVSSAQAIPLASTPQRESLIINVRAGCGAGFTMVNGACIRTPARAAVRRGAVRR